VIILAEELKADSLLLMKWKAAEKGFSLTLQTARNDG
jgi:hypothetical protein